MAIGFHSSILQAASVAYISCLKSKKTHLNLGIYYKLEMMFLLIFQPWRLSSLLSRNSNQVDLTYQTTQDQECSAKPCVEVQIICSLGVQQA